MAEYLSISAIRYEIKELKGKTAGEVLPYFKKVLGPPDEIWENEGQVIHFSYDYENRGIRVVTDGKRWGIDVLVYFAYAEEKLNRVNISFREAISKMQSYAFCLGLEFNPLNIIITSYAFDEFEDDEPIKF